MHIAFADGKTKTHPIPVHAVVAADFSEWLKKQSDTIQTWVSQTQYSPEANAVGLVPGTGNALEAVILGMKNGEDFWAFGALPSKLPAGVYALVPNNALKKVDQRERAYLAFGLGHYQFATYKSDVKPRLAKLAKDTEIDVNSVTAFLHAIERTRDMINTPAEDMGPAEIEARVKAVAKAHKATVSVIKGDQLLTKNYASVHTVGRASHREPRVIDLRWKPTKNKKALKKVTLVGKGVCFDSGGLDIKPASGMLLMKKDMAGSAMMLALADLIMAHQLPIELRLLIGAVDNVISGNSYRPGDVIKTRAGKTIEITNTDAEGRVVLCDLLYEACTENPEVLIDFATLTGAARVALGEDLPALFAQPQSFANDLLKSAERVKDPIWQLPLAENYQDKLKSEVADLSNCSDSGYGGAITAALFLQAFVKPGIQWAHMDVAAWHFKPKAGRPVGGDAFAVRAMFDYLQQLIA